jgi:flagellin
MVNRLEAMSRRWATADRGAVRATERLATGVRITRAADDAAGLAIAERLRGQSGGALRAQRNVQDGISVVQTVDAVLAEVGSILQRTRELAVQHASGTMRASDRAAAQSEADALRAEVARLASSTRFNGASVLDGGTLAVQLGGSDEDAIAAGLPDLGQFVSDAVFSLDGSGTTTTTTTTTTTGGGSNGNGNGNGNGNSGGNGNGNSGGNGNGNGNGATSGNPGKGGGGAVKVVTTVTFTTPAGPPIARIDAALGAIAEQRAALGAFQNRLEYALGTLATTHEQLVAAESRIRDADVAGEVVALARHRVSVEINRALAAQAHVDARRAIGLLAA